MIQSRPVRMEFASRAIVPVAPHPGTPMEPWVAAVQMPAAGEARSTVPTVCVTSALRALCAGEDTEGEPQTCGTKRM